MSSSRTPGQATSNPVITQRSAWIPLVVTGLITGAAFIAVYVGLQRDPTPHELPIAVVGEQWATAARTGFGDAAAITQVETMDDGAALVRTGDVVAVLGAASPSAVRLEYAGAAGLSESGAARTLTAGLARTTGVTVEEADIVPLVRYDSRGLSAFYVVFGVTLASFVLAQGLTAATDRVRLVHRLYAMAGFAVAIGLIAATIAGPVYGALTAPFPALALSLALLSAASAFATKALGAWLGPAGIGLSVLTLTTIGNATSGATVGFDLLPRWAQALSGVLPPGAGVRAVNDFGYFDGSHAGTSLAILVLWFLAGLVLVLLRARTTRQRPAISTPIPDMSAAAA